MRHWMKIALCLPCLASAVAGCDTASDEPGAVDKSDAADGKMDALADLCEELGAPSDCDICQEAGWYGDQVCDSFCAKPDPDCGGGGTEAQPSPSCQAAATKLLTDLGPLSLTSTEVASFTLVSAHSDREVFRVVMETVRGHTSEWLINAETLGGDPCLIYGAQLVAEEIDIRDSGGSTVGTPSTACTEAAVSAIKAVEAVNEKKATIGSARLLDAFSDREVLRVRIKRGTKSDAYVVSTETLGGDPCLVYGLQLRSEQIDLRTTAE